MGVRNQKGPLSNFTLFGFQTLENFFSKVIGSISNPFGDWWCKVLYGRNCKHVAKSAIPAEISSLIQKSHDFGHFHGGPPPL